MANIKSNKKSHIQDTKKYQNRRPQLAAARTQIKKTRNEATNEQLTLAYKQLDTIARKGIIHKNKANRLKSRLAKAINANA